MDGGCQGRVGLQDVDLLLLVLVIGSYNHVNYTKYDIEYHMVFHVAMVTFWMTLF